MTPADSLRRAVAHAAPRLLDLPDPGRRPGPGKWSPKETLGHLSDSAMVNYDRIVQASAGGGLVFEGYDQVRRVEAGRYAEADWPDLVSLWRLLNAQVARVVEGIADDVLDAPHAEHSLDRTAWLHISPDQPATLRDLIVDYVGHLRHHLVIIDPALVADA